MSAIAKPFYSAVLIDPDDEADLGPIDIPEARTDDQARDLATKRAGDWLRENGKERVIVRISIDGRVLAPVEVHS
jgi:hypothetical protein